jgi:hypothetical protein
MIFLGTCMKSDIPHYMDGTCVNFHPLPASDPVPVEGVVLPENEERWKNLALRQAQELAEKDARFVAMEEKHNEAYQEAIAQRDAARKENAATLKVLEQTVYDHVKRDERLFEELGLSTSEGRCINDRAEKAEAALATERARALQDAFKSLPEISNDVSYNTAVIRAEEAILDLIQK